MGSRIGNRPLLQAVRDFLKIEDKKGAAAFFDVDDWKGVIALLAPGKYQEFTTSVNAINAGTSAGFALDAFAVGGVAENGQGAAQQTNSTDQTAQTAAGGLPNAATDWDYKILSAVGEVQLTVAQALAEAGNDIETAWIQFAPIITPSQAATDNPILGVGRIPLTRTNIGDGMTVDADQLTYTFPIYHGQSDSQDVASTWPGWIPGIQGNGLRLQVWKRTGSGGALAAWATAVQFRTRVYGLRFPKGTFPIR